MLKCPAACRNGAAYGGPYICLTEKPGPVKTCWGPGETSLGEKQTFYDI